MRRDGIAGLTAVERTIALCSIAGFEVDLGGVAAFFHNSSGDLSHEAVEALLEIGATQQAIAIQTGRDLLKNSSWRALVAEDAFEPLTQQFHSDDRDVFSRLCEYIEAHASELAVT